MAPRILSSVLARATSCAGLVYTVCEWFHGLPFEVRNIWGDPKFPLHLRLIYLFARYTSLICEISQLVALNYLLNGPSSHRICTAYWFTQHYAGAFEMNLLHIMLSKRVYALWCNNIYIGVLLVLLSTAFLVAFISLGGVAINGMQYMNSNCFMVEAIPKELMYLCFLEVFIQVCMWTLTFVKYVSFRRHPRDQKAFRLMTHVNREGFIVSILASLIPVAVIVDGALVRVASGMPIMSYLAIPIFIAIVSSAVCRSIHGIHSLSLRLRAEEEGLILTSVDPFD
ncbi:hypothetical protein P691DRAFT_801687 [Macrolepiota fuliginosa MF-IS2]|uniref:Uncharacterized protein n=1 Tax=Macrolepiota fuliginosa MF-IS2 TaxID=1400762 RepID=A0A9P5XAK0_9AGAR|nr:hypothetical protein P691DRAFT_801687 [Macrolepiota fuliginosa MF-IS2]